MGNCFKIYRSNGRIHIGDQILALNQHFLRPLSPIRKSSTNSVSSVPLKQHVDVTAKLINHLLK